jgi:DNA-binding XRE family transcriptional regulator
MPRRKRWVYKPKKLIDKAMHQMGLSDETLADILGVAKMSVWYWRKGIYAPQSEHMMALCAILDLAPEDLFAVVEE